MDRFYVLEERRTPPATSRPLDIGSTWYLRGRHLHSLGPWVDWMSRSKVYRHINWFFYRRVGNLQRENATCLACGLREKNKNKKKQATRSPFFQLLRYESILSCLLKSTVRKLNFCNFVFLLASAWPFACMLVLLFGFDFGVWVRVRSALQLLEGKGLMEVWVCRFARIGLFCPV